MAQINIRDFMEGKEGRFIAFTTDMQRAILATIFPGGSAEGHVFDICPSQAREAEPPRASVRYAHHTLSYEISVNTSLAAPALAAALQWKHCGTTSARLQSVLRTAASQYSWPPSEEQIEEIIGTIIKRMGYSELQTTRLLFGEEVFDRMVLLLGNTARVRCIQGSWDTVGYAIGTPSHHVMPCLCAFSYGGTVKFFEVLRRCDRHFNDPAVFFHLFRRAVPIRWTSQVTFTGAC